MSFKLYIIIVLTNFCAICSANDSIFSTYWSDTNFIIKSKYKINDSIVWQGAYKTIKELNNNFYISKNGFKDGFTLKIDSTLRIDTLKNYKINYYSKMLHKVGRNNVYITNFNNDTLFKYPKEWICKIIQKKNGERFYFLTDAKKTVYLDSKFDTVFYFDKYVPYENISNKESLLYFPDNKNEYYLLFYINNEFYPLTDELEGSSYDIAYLDSIYLVLNLKIDSNTVYHFNKNFKLINQKSYSKNIKFTNFSKTKELNYFEINDFDSTKKIPNQLDSFVTLNSKFNYEYIILDSTISYFFFKSKNDTDKITIMPYSGHQVFDVPWVFWEEQKKILEYSNIVIPLLRGAIENGYHNYLDGLKEKKLNTINDLITLSKHFKKQNKKVYLYGESHGAYISLMAGIMNHHLFDRLILIAPPINLYSLIENDPNLIVDFGTKNIIKEFKLSPHTRLESIDSLPNISLIIYEYDELINLNEFKKIMPVIDNLTNDFEYYILKNSYHNLVDPPTIQDKNMKKRMNIVLDLLKK